MDISLPGVTQRSRQRDEHAGDSLQRALPVVAAHSTMPNPFDEAFRLLAMNVLALLGDSPSRGITVFSRSRGEGRTLVAVELARALAAHTDVLLIDGHASPSGRHESLLIDSPRPGDEPSRAGLDMISTNHSRLWLSAEASHRASTNADLTTQIETAFSEGMLVVVDAPASDVSSDAYMFAQRLRNVLYVLRNKPQDMAPHRRVMDHLKRLDARVLGIVLNDR